MWVVLLMVVETEVLTKEIFLEAPDTFTKQHIIHCLYFLFWLSSASVPFGFGGLATRLLGFLSCEWVAVACGDRPDVHHHIHHLTSVVWPSLSGHEVTRWPLLKNKHLMCVLQFFIVGGWHFFNLNKSHFFFSSLLPSSLPCTLTWKPLPWSRLGLSGGHVLSFVLTDDGSWLFSRTFLCPFTELNPCLK